MKFKWQNFWDNVYATATRSDPSGNPDGSLAYALCTWRKYTLY